MVIDRPSAPAIGAPKVSLHPMRPLPTGFVPPALPTRAKEPPGGSDWWHEIKHNGIRVIARKTDGRIKLYSRPGNDLTHRFPLIVDALAQLRARTCILDGEAVACGEDGIALFELVRHWRNGEAAFLFAFDVIELNGDDLRAQPLERRKATLARLLSRSTEGIQINEHLEHDDGGLVFEHACRLGLEGIVSKRKGSLYRSGRTADWMKAKNPKAPAVTRVLEEDWNGRRSITPPHPPERRK